MPIRTFVAVWPPPALVRIDGPDGVRFVPPERRHVTLRFLGDVAGETDLVVVGERLAAAGLRACSATVGATTTVLGRGVLVVRVDGLDALASGVIAVTRDLGSHPPDDRPFNGHITVARGRDARRLRGLPVGGGAWAVNEVAVVTSRLGGRAGPTYETVATIPLG